MKQQFFKKMQSGRSMVEIMGVLAVMGVLSIGAMMSYNMANSTYTTNQIVGGISKLQTLITTRQLRSTHDVNKFLEKASVRYLATESAVEITKLGASRVSPKLFEIKLENVPQNIYNELKQTSGLSFCNEMTRDGAVDVSSASVSAVLEKMDQNTQKCVLLKEIKKGTNDVYDISFIIRQSGHKF